MSEAFDRLVEVMRRLRAECPWTREQTHASLRRYVLEEAYETAEAIDLDDADHLREELGDLLMQVVIHAAIAESDDEGWTIDDVVETITEKLVHRNPHVFGDVEVTSAAEVDANWQRLKAERKRRTHALEGIPAELPALMAADKVLGRSDGPIRGDDLGARLLRLVAEARAAGLDAEAELRAAVRRHAG